MNKEFLPKIENINTRYRLAKIKSILKMIYDKFPLEWMINLFSKTFIVGAVLTYLNSIGISNWFISLTLHLWIIMSFKNMIQSFYWSWKEIKKVKGSKTK